MTLRVAEKDEDERMEALELQRRMEATLIFISHFGGPKRCILRPPCSILFK